MQIGTAVPSAKELQTVKHHFIQHKSIHDHYNVGTFEKEALQTLQSLFKTHDIVIMVGGSGLYNDAVIKGLDYFPEVDPNIRGALNEQLKNEGIETLQNQLKVLDYKTYKTIAIDNPHRVIRALEICIGTKKPYASFLNKNKEPRRFKTITVGLTAERPIIYDRIHKRVDIMMTSGLLHEVKSLATYQHLNALKTVGYKELFNYLNGTWSLEFAVSEIKKNTRRFAKRQLTWFKKNNEIKWFQYEQPTEQIVLYIESVLKKL